MHRLSLVMCLSLLKKIINGLWQIEALKPGHILWACQPFAVWCARAGGGLTDTRSKSQGEKGGRAGDESV
jgi:hypothetical protein